MPLASGARLGPCEVLGLIGAGGMGEVYKARDTRLDRTVAIKVLPAHVSADPERRARFEREAKTISQLNHPHICTLHDVGEAVLPSPESPVPSPASISYLVMEHLDGENGTPRAQPLVQTPAAERWPEFSPDGYWLAYGSNVSGRDEVYVRPYPGPGVAEQVSLDGGTSPAWHPNGRELFFVILPDTIRKQRMMAVAFAAGSPPRVGRPRVRFAFDQRALPFSCTPTRCYDVAPDGQRFYVTQIAAPQPPPVVTHINLIQNWFEELKTKVPVK